MNGLIWKLFLWLGTKLFDQIDIYAPGGDDADVIAITFSNDSEYLSKIGTIE